MIKALTEEMENDCQIVEEYLMLSASTPPNNKQYSAMIGLVSQTRSLSEQLRIKTAYLDSLPHEHGS